MGREVCEDGTDMDEWDEAGPRSGNGVGACPSMFDWLVAWWRATLRSVWRLFWNQIVTDFISLGYMNLR